jgi:hypothetical protein
MPIEHYKDFEICEMYHKDQKPYYIVCKEFKEDPFWEIGGIQYDSIKQAKIDIDDDVYGEQIKHFHPKAIDGYGD